MTLLDQGWTAEHAKGHPIASNSTVPFQNGTQTTSKDQDWCASREKDWTTIEAHLEFVAYELCHSYERIGAALKSATTAGEAKEAVEPYVRPIGASPNLKGPRLAK